MASTPVSLPNFHLLRNTPSPQRSVSALSFLPYRTPSFRPRFLALKTGPKARKVSSRDAYGSDLLRKPEISPPAKDFAGENREDHESDEEELIDWEDQILEDTVPLVGFIRTILHSGRLIARHVEECSRSLLQIL